MKNLENEELKQSIKENILYAFKKSKAVALEIEIRFIGYWQKEYFKSIEKISYFANEITYRNVNFDQEIIKFNDIINIIIDNMHYNSFAYIDSIEEIGENECHGHGEYWSTDKFTFIYKRLD